MPKRPSDASYRSMCQETHYKPACSLALRLGGGPVLIVTVRVVIEVMADSHQEAGQSSAAPQL